MSDGYHGDFNDFYEGVDTRTMMTMAATILVTMSLEVLQEAEATPLMEECYIRENSSVKLDMVPKWFPLLLRETIIECTRCPAVTMEVNSLTWEQIFYAVLYSRT